MMSREVLTLFTTEAGFLTLPFESGEEAIAHLETSPGTSGNLAILTDLQMPGLCGVELGERLRAVASAGTRLLAMSGSKPAAEALAAYDGFLLKPFSVDDLIATLRDPLPAHQAAVAVASEESGEALFAIVNRNTYESFSRSMPPEQLLALYAMCLDDADKRLATMRAASAAGNTDAFRRAAHAVKGGCGMVGATQLANLAAAMEENGPPEVDDSAPFEEFLAASARLRGMLNSHKPGA